MKKEYIKISKRQLRFLDRIRRDCGHKGSPQQCRKAILEALLACGRELKVNVKGVKSCEELTQRFRRCFKDVDG